MRASDGDLNNDRSKSGMRNFIYRSVFYVVLTVISLLMMIFTDAVISPAYVLTGAIVGGVALTIRFVLNTRPLGQRVYDIAVFILGFAFATQEITGKLAIVVGFCLSMIITSYFLYYWPEQISKSL